MTAKTSFLNSNGIAFIIPITLILGLVFLINSSAFTAHQNTMSLFVTIDFILTIPLIYFLLIRNTKISNLTIAPFLIGSIILASYIIPVENQDTLSVAKMWLIPIIELSVITIVILKVRKVIHNYKAVVNNHHDFYSVLQDTCSSVFPGISAKLIANEIALFYYGFFNFKTKKLQPHEYTNYKGSGILSTLSSVIFLVAIEMVTIHILTAKWSTTLAWILTGLSIYSALQLIGIIRSVPKRPIQVKNNQLIMRFGILSEAIIPIEAIDAITVVNASDVVSEKMTKTLSLLGALEQSNIAIHLKSPQKLNFIYGKPKPFTKLLCFVDDHQFFKTEVESHLSKP